MNSLDPPSVVVSGQLAVMLNARCIVPRAGVLDLLRDCLDRASAVVPGGDHVWGFQFAPLDHNLQFLVNTQ